MNKEDTTKETDNNSPSTHNYVFKCPLCGISELCVEKAQSEMWRIPGVNLYQHHDTLDYAPVDQKKKPTKTTMTDGDGVRCLGCGVRKKSAYELFQQGLLQLRPVQESWENPYSYLARLFSYEGCAFYVGDNMLEHRTNAVTHLELRVTDAVRLLVKPTAKITQQPTVDGLVFFIEEHLIHPTLAIIVKFTDFPREES